MRIIWSPQRRDIAANIIKAGDVLTIDGVAFDFSPLPDGATLPANAIDHDLIGNVDRVNGEIVIRLILPHGPVADETVRFPQPSENVPNGPVVIPDTWTVPEVTEADDLGLWSATETETSTGEAEHD